MRLKNKLINRRKETDKIILGGRVSVSLVLTILVLTILTISIVSAYAVNYVQGPNFIPTTGERAYPIFDRSMCGAGQDFILQVSPLGCTPNVVRSDLLEDQNVPVFCPITATQINPLVDIEAINRIVFTFDGPKPVGIQDVRYLPARAALGQYGAEVNQPILNNIGYAVIILNRQANESTIPDFFEGTLKANIQYDVKNSHGVGRDSFYLPVITDSEWENSYKQYSFWDGRGYLRAESISDDDAVISVYSDRENYGTGVDGSQRILASERIDIGESSREIPIPGFDFCLGGMELELRGLESPDTRVRLNVNGETFELKRGEKFLDNKCEIRGIDNQGLSESVVVNCNADSDSKTRGSFVLSISPKINVSVQKNDGTFVFGEYKVGDILYKDEESKRNVFLGYIGENRKGERFIMMAITQHTNSQDFLNSIDKKLLESFARTEQDALEKGNFINNIKLAVSDLSSFANALIRGSDFSAPIYEDTIGQTVEFPLGEFLNGLLRIKQVFTGGDSFSSTYTKRVIRYVGFSDPVEKELTAQVQEYYDKAIEEYEITRESFSEERWPESRDSTLGEDALRGEIGLSYALSQKRTVVELCDELEDSYPNTHLPDICTDERKLSSIDVPIADVLINGRIYEIAFDRIREPTFKEYGAVVTVSGTDGFDKRSSLRKGQRVSLSETEWFELEEVRDDRITIIANVNQSGIVSAIIESKRFTIDFEDYEIIGTNRYQIRLDEVNLEKMARVTVNPQVDYARTEANFGFKIGVEKRGIKLSPERTREIISSVNKTLDTINRINDGLGTLVSAGKAACIGVGGYLTVKNFFADLAGKGIARQKVMRAEGGWFDKCEEAAGRGEYGGSVDSCLLKNSGEIDASVNEYADAIEEQNGEFKPIQERHTTKGGLLKEDIIDTGALRREFIDKDGNLLNELTSNIQSSGTIEISGKSVAVSDVLTSTRINSTYMSLSQAKNLQLNSRLLDSGNEVVRQAAWNEIQKDLGDVYVNSQNNLDRVTFAGSFGNAAALFSSRQNLKEIPLTETKLWSDVKGDFTSGGGNIGDNTFVFKLKDESNGRGYLVTLDNDFVVSQTYNITGTTLTVLDSGSINPLGLRFKKYDAGSYKNRCTNCQVKYYETGAYKGLPAIVPFDLNDGWYAAVRSDLPILGGIQGYTDAGRVSSFYLCNVGKDGREEFFSGFGDDNCRGFVPGERSEPPDFPGLSESEAKRLSNLAGGDRGAIYQASQAYKTGIDYVYIFGQKIEVGEPATGTPAIQCQDFMSPSDCNLLFNVCDPVICPSSRCDFGGAYPVQDVVQSGLVGSLMLCLPNSDEVVVPICLSGVHAGVDAYSSVLDSYQQCLQESLNTGKTVGICDEIHSVYMCEFVWRQGLPLAKILVPKAVGKISGLTSARGGGEYLEVDDALQRAGDSLDYFTQYYADDSFRAFKSRSTEDVGSTFCRGWVSLNGGVNVLDTLIAPDSPVQFYGRFDEIPFTSATNPPTSHYKVYYHIYAGKDLPAYYQVYLKGGGSSFFQDTAFRRIVANGFIASGEYASNTSDFTAPSGYSQMCVVVNGKEECGFKQVSTEFAVTYVTDQYLKEQASQAGITSEAACVSGTPSVYNLISPNIQSGVEGAVNPAIYNQGITRVCSTDNPGKGTDLYLGTEKQRWREVGNCGNQNLRCWLDSDSVQTAVKSTDIEDQILGEVTPDYTEAFLKEAGYVTNFNEFVEDVVKEPNFLSRVQRIDANYSFVFFDNQRGFLNLLKGEAYGDFAISKLPPVTAAGADRIIGAEGGDNITTTTEQIPSESSQIVVAEKTNVGEGDFVSVQDTNYFVELVSIDSHFFTFRFYEKGKNDPLICRTIAGTQENSLLINNINSFPRQGSCDRLGISIQVLSYNSESNTINLKIEIEAIVQTTTPNIVQESNLVTRVNNGKVDSFVNVPGTDYFVKLTEAGFVKSSNLISTAFQVYEKGTQNPITCWKSLGFINVKTLRINTDYSIPKLDSCSQIGISIQVLRYSISGDELDFRVIKGDKSVATAEIERIESGSSGTTTGTTSTPTSATCSNLTGCQKIVGQKIIKIANEEKTLRGISDAQVKADTGANSFECLVLQIARVESDIRHCSQIHQNGDPLYCDGDITQLRSNLNNEESLGVMQINNEVHKVPDIEDIDVNIHYGVDLLASSYASDSSRKAYTCYRPDELGPVIREGDFQTVFYSGWQRSLRGYNGWNDKSRNNCLEKNEDGSYKRDSNGNLIPEGNPAYVDDILRASNKERVGEIFSECA